MAIDGTDDGRPKKLTGDGLRMTTAALTRLVEKSDELYEREKQKPNY